MRSAFELPWVRPSPVGWGELLGSLATRFFWGCFAAVLGLMSWNAFWRLAETLVRDCDEARYGVAASEMLHRHSMLVTTYAGATEFWNLKPPLGYWLLDLSYWMVGETALGLRLPAAVCAILATALTMLLARRIAGPRAALLAGIILATSFGFLTHHGARSGELDVPLTLLLLVFLALAPRLLDSRAARLAAGWVLALGFLLKSFAILPFIIAVAVYYAISRGIASWRIWPLPLGIVVVTGLTWAIARSVCEGSYEFVRRMFLEDLLLRSTTTIDPGLHTHPWDYLGTLFDRFAPWPLIVALAWGLGRKSVNERLSPGMAQLLGCYALIPIVLFTLAQTHHSHYIIPTYPAWAILAAVGTLEVLKRSQRLELAGFVTGLIAMGLLACEVRLILHAQIQDRMPRSQAFLGSLGTWARASVRPLQTAFTPSYSERFFLQVVDGFVLADLSASDRSFRANGMVLLRKSDSAGGDPRTLTATVLAQNDNYLLVRSATPATLEPEVRREGAR